MFKPKFHHENPAKMLGFQRDHTLQVALLGLSLGAIFWFLDSLMDSFIFQEASFLQEFAHPDAREWYLRISVAVGITCFTFVYLRAKQTQRALQIFLDISQEAGDGIFVRNSQGHFLYVNDTWAQCLGYSRNELLTMNLCDIDPKLPPEELDTAWEMLTRDKSLRAERIHRTKSGTDIAVEISVRYVKIDHSEFAVSIVRDISERKSREALLKRSQQQASHAERIARLGSYESDFLTGQTFWSAGMHELLHVPMSHGPLSTDAAFALIHPEDREQVSRQFQEDFRLLRPHLSQHRFLLSNGKIMWADCAAEFTSDANGKALRMVGTVQDVTDKKISELALTNSEEKIRLLLESAGEGILSVDNKGICTFINPAAQRLLRYSKAEDIVGKNLHEKIHHTRTDGTPYLGAECRASVAFKENIPVHVDDEVFWRADGTSFEVEYVVRPLNHNGKTIGSVYAFLDISLRKHAEMELAKSTEKLREANRLKDLFTDIMRHDLLNPASVARNSAELLLKLESDPTKSQLLQSIHRSTESLIDLCENASRYAKAANTLQIELDDYDLSSLLERAVRDYDLQIQKKKMTVHWDFAGERFASVNPLIYDVFANLISNAIKYSPEGTEICLGVKDHTESWLVCVADQGDGIPDKDKESVFTRFERLGKHSVKGTGLGLAIARQIVSLHKGKIWAANREDGRPGSQFCVLLPKSKSYKEKTPHLTATAKPNGKVHPTESTIMVIDDSPDALLIQKTLLEKQGYKVVTALGPQEGFRLLEDPSVVPNLILLDVNMTDMSGPEFLDLAHQRYPELMKKIPTVLLTAMDTPPPSRAIGMINKTLGSEQLFEKVRGFVSDMGSCKF